MGLFYLKVLGGCALFLGLGLVMYSSKNVRTPARGSMPANSSATARAADGN